MHPEQTQPCYGALGAKISCTTGILDVTRLPIVCTTASVAPDQGSRHHAV